MLILAPVPVTLVDIAEAAWRARETLRSDPTTDAYRILHGYSEGLPGVVADLYGDSAVVTYRRGHREQAAELARHYVEQYGLAGALVRERRGAPELAAGHTPDGEFPVLENKIQYLIDLRRHGNPGLFLDARHGREFVSQHSAGRRMLNLFAFSGSLGLVASRGGARSVVHVDMDKRALAWIARNYQQNALPIDDRDLVKANIYQQLRKSRFTRKRFDAIILDAPPLTEHGYKSDTTPGMRGLPYLVGALANMLAEDGWLLTLMHRNARGQDDRTTTEGRLLERSAVQLEPIWRGESGSDFPEQDDSHRLWITAWRRPRSARPAALGSLDP